MTTWLQAVFCVIHLLIQMLLMVTFEFENVEWPAQSSDVNTIELVSDELDRRMKAKHPTDCVVAKGPAAVFRTKRKERELTELRHREN